MIVRLHIFLLVAIVIVLTLIIGRYTLTGVRSMILTGPNTVIHGDRRFYVNLPTSSTVTGEIPIQHRLRALLIITITSVDRLPALIGQSRVPYHLVHGRGLLSALGHASRDATQAADVVQSLTLIPPFTTVVPI
jgi:hypothetical protein